MFLVLAHQGDQLAGRVLERLRERHGADRTRLLTADDLALNTRWAFRQEGTRIQTALHFTDGTRLSSTELTSVFNRLRFATAPQFNSASESDRDYGLMEMYAFLLSWLSSLECLVVNRASPRGLGGDVRGAAEWLLLAGRLGLPTRGLRFVTNSRRFPKREYDPYVPLDGAGLTTNSRLKETSKAILGRSPAHFLEPVGSERQRVVIIGTQTYGSDLPPALKEGCMLLAQTCGCSLTEFMFARAVASTDANPDWKFCEGNSFPLDLKDNETEALIELLETGVS